MGTVRRIVFVDLDRTLFDTPQFVQDIWQVVGELYPKVDVTHERAIIADWYEVVVDEWRHYRFKQHVEQATGASADSIAAELRKRLAGRQYAYPDAGVITAWEQKGYEVRILSFGDPWFQAIKLDLVPQITQPRDLVLESKSGFIARQFPQARGFMVDDRLINDLPSRVQGILIDRQSGIAINKESDIIVINSLERVQELL